jgi:signal transduction histidine kinase/FixJ family two-component response regulator
VSAPLRVLLVEDSEDDAALVARVLQRYGFTLELARVETREAMAGALARQPWDVVIADYTLPHFSAPEALALAGQTDPDLPVIVVTGQLGDETAVEVLRAGARDFVRKANWTRLAPAVQREIDEAAERRARKRAERDRELARAAEQAAYRDAAAARERLAYLADAGVVLASSLDYNLILERFAELTVPRLADCCVVEIAEPAATGPSTRPTWTTVTAVAPGVTEPVLAALTVPPAGETVPWLAAAAMSAGQAILLSDSTGQVATAETATEQWASLHASGIHSVVAAPLLAQGQSLGALILARTATRPAFDDGDSRLVGDLVYRAALAMANARYYREAQAAVRTRNDLLSIVSHDLRNAVTALKGNAQLLRLELRRDPERIREQLDARLARIDATATNMGRLLDDLVDLNRLHQGQPLDLQREPTDLVALAQHVVAVNRPPGEQHQVRVEATVDSLVGHWDRARVERVIVNLLDNAIKYSPDGGRVEIDVGPDPSRPDTWARLRVSDEGMGIPAEDLERIFADYQRGSNATGRVAGSGIGLASSRQIVERHGGTIIVDSDVGRGSTFTVYLPLAPVGC